MSDYTERTSFRARRKLFMYFCCTSRALLFLAILSLIFSTNICEGQTDVEAEANNQKLEAVGYELEYDDNQQVSGAYIEKLAKLEDLALLSDLEHLEWLTVGVIMSPSTTENEKELTSEPSILVEDEKKAVEVDVFNLSDIAKLSNLESLSIGGTAVTDESIEALSSLKSLKHLYLNSSRVTAAGIKLLKKEFPELQIDRTWHYFVGVFDGRAVLDLDRAMVFFADKDVSASGSGGGGGVLQVSMSDKSGGSRSSAGGGSLLNSISAQVVCNFEGVVITVDKHKIEIRNDGAELIVDGQSFAITDKKLSITVNADGVVSF